MSHADRGCAAYNVLMSIDDLLERFRRSHSFVRFAGVGGVGFVVDSSVLYLCVYGFGIGVYLGRCISYLTSATVTWYLNRRFTFPAGRHHHKGWQWLTFVACSVIAGGLNYLAYAAYLRLAGQGPVNLLVGVGVGACAGLSVSYTLARRFTFRAREPAHAGSSPV
jgi:putative flippase GtrA